MSRVLASFESDGSVTERGRGAVGAPRPVALRERLVAWSDVAERARNPADLPVLDFASDAVDALATLTAAVSAGELTPSEGAALGRARVDPRGPKIRRIELTISKRP
jgi:hypothetical protein